MNCMDATTEEEPNNVLIRFNFKKDEKNSTSDNKIEKEIENPIEFEDEDIYDEVHEIPYDRQENVRKYDENSSGDIMQFAEIKDVENCFQCSLCQYTTQFLSSLHKHKSSVHGAPKNFKCKFCHRRFATQMQKHIHTQKKHSKKFHKCPYCSYSTLSGKKDIEKHVLSSHPGHEFGNNMKFDGFIRVGSKGLYRCELCSYVNRKLEPMQTHAKMHKSKLILKCLHCHFMVDRQILYRQHLEEAHKLAKEIFICKKCYFQSEEWTEYTEHILEPHDNHECSECLFSTPDADIFFAHFELHKSKNNKCDKCEYVGETEQQLKEHLQKQHAGQISNDKNIQNDIEIEEFIERRENLDISDEKLREAINGIKNKIISVSEASTIFQIPIDYLYSKTRDEETLDLQDGKENERKSEEPSEGHSEETPNQEDIATGKESEDKDAVRSSGRFEIEPVRGFPQVPEETENPEETSMENIDNLNEKPLEITGENINVNMLRMNDQLTLGCFDIQENQSGKSYKCNLCSFQTHELPLVKSHLKEAHEGILECPHCHNMITSDAEEFQKHLDQHCSHCTFQSMDSNKLKLHMLSHVPRYRSTNTSGVKEEIRIIIEENEKLNAREGIQIIVENEKEKSDNDDNNESINIIGRPIKVIKILKNQCFDCLGIFKSRYCLVDHRKRFHNLKKPHSCTYCMDVFESYKNLKSHYYRVHQATFHSTGPLFKCPLCNFNSDLLKPITRHIIKNHQRTPTGFKTSRR